MTNGKPSQLDRIGYNAYVKKTLIEGGEPLEQAEWIKQQAAKKKKKSNQGACFIDTAGG